MKRPAFQFYPADWRNNANLGRCSPAARGIWVDILCVLHDSDEYGVVRWPLVDLANAAHAPMKLIRELVEKNVLKGGDKQVEQPYIYTPRSGRRDGTPVTLVPIQAGPVWYSSRMVKDEHVRTIRGESTRFSEELGDEPKHTPKASPKPPIGDGSSSSSSPSGINTNTSGTTYLHHSAVRLNGSHAAGLPKPECPPDCPHQRIRDLWAELMPELQQPAKWSEARATALRTRWREEAAENRWATEDDGLRFFSDLFRWCRKSKFLMGKAPPKPGAAPFSLTVPWLIKAENWAKVQEGNYHHEG